MTTTLARKMDFPKALACSLVEYAKVNSDYARWLEAFMRSLDHKPHDSSLGKEIHDPTDHALAASVLRPPHAEAACLRTRMLFDHVIACGIDGSLEAEAHFINWLYTSAASQVEPPLPLPHNQIVIGWQDHIGPGPLVGKFPELVLPVQVILARSDVLRLSGLQYTQHIVTASLQPVANAIVGAKGEACMKLELDRWLEGGKDIRLYEALDDDVLAWVQIELEKVGVTCGISEDSRGIAALAMPPAFEGSFLSVVNRQRIRQV